MAFRSDVTVDWFASPRIIEVAAPSTEITIQDLHDTCRQLESELTALDEDQLITSAGKENLGGGVQVGITATLLNALVAFEARPGTDYIQCRVNGGNLVAVDDLGADLDSPIFPTAFTQVVTTASSSATTQSQAQLEYTTFSNGIWLDAVNGVALSGSDPLSSLIGNAQTPVNNVPDLNLIQQARGLPKTVYLIGNYTLDTGDDLTNYRLFGQNAVRSFLTINSGAVTTGLEIYECYITGNLDGGTIIRQSVIDTLNYINGFVYESMIANSTISLGGVQSANFFSCYSGVPGTGTPTLDCNGAGSETTPLAIRDYNGGIRLIDLTGGAAVSIDLVAGQVKIDPSCTNGNVVVRGNGKVINAVTGEHMGSGTYFGNLVLLNEANFGDHIHEIWTRLDLDPAKPNTYNDDGSGITNADFTLTKNDNGNGTFTVDKT